mgnify:CR=1 FL=1
MSRLDDIKAAYDNIQVPAELKERVLQSMECGKCGGAGPYVKIEDFANKMDAQEEAKEAWNRRANDGTD